MAQAPQVYSKSGVVITLDELVAHLRSAASRCNSHLLVAILHEYQDCDLAIGRRYRILMQTVRNLSKSIPRKANDYLEVLEVLLEEIPLTRRTEDEINELEQLRLMTAPTSPRLTPPFTPSSSPAAPPILITNLHVHGEKRVYDEKEWQIIEATDERRTNKSRGCYHAHTFKRRVTYDDSLPTNLQPSPPQRPICISLLTESLKSLQFTSLDTVNNTGTTNEIVTPLIPPSTPF